MARSTLPKPPAPLPWPVTGYRSPVVGGGSRCQTQQVHEAVVYVFLELE